MNLQVKLLLGFAVLLSLMLVFSVKMVKIWIRNFIRERVIGVRHNQLVSMFRACPVSKGAIIFLGDSITEGGNWPELFPGKNVLNRGIGGDITAGLLARLDEVIRHQPSKIFIAIGTNDLAIGFSNEKILKNYRAIIEQLKADSPGTKIYVQSVLPVGKRVLFGHKNEKILPLNQELRQMCAELGITYIDLYPQFLNGDGYLDNQFTNDNLHLLGNAYLLWKDQIEGYVNG
jgi:lysophospholipase L1-like esterase